MYYLGVNFDLTAITAGVVDEEGKILYKKSIPTLKYRNPGEIIKDIVQLCRDIAMEAGLDFEKDIESIGVGSYGRINLEKGEIIYSSYFDFVDYPIVSEFKKHTDKPVYADNYSNCYALAESRFGATKGYKNSVIVTIGNSIGSGIIINGELYYGPFYGGGELGHHVILFDGEKCECGRNGCWAAYATTKALVKNARLETIRHPETEMVRLVNGDIRMMSYKIPFEAAKLGDPYAQELLHLYSRYVAVGLINIINIIQPEIIAIGGTIRKVGGMIIDPVNKMVEQKMFGHHSKLKTKIVLSDLDYDAVIIGATMLRNMRK